MALVTVRALCGVSRRESSDIEAYLMVETNHIRDLLIRERDLLLRQRDALHNQIMGLERALGVLAVEGIISELKPGGRRTQTKGIVLRLLEEAGVGGLTADIAVELA